MSRLIELAEQIEKLSVRQYGFQRSIASVLSAHKPRGITGHDWDDKDAFDQAIKLIGLAPSIAKELRTLSQGGKK